VPKPRRNSRSSVVSIFSNQLVKDVVTNLEKAEAEAQKGLAKDILRKNGFHKGF